MPIMLSCACGKTLRVPDPAPGVRVRCPACAAVFPVSEPEASPRPAATGAPARPPAPPSPPPRPAEEDDTDRGGYGLESAEKPASHRRRRASADDDADEDAPRRTPARASRSRRRRSGKKSAQRGVYLVGGTLAILAGLGLILMVRATGEPGAGKVTVCGAALAIFGLVSIIQALTDTMPDDDV